MSIVVDTNIFGGACLGTGAASRMVAGRVTGQYTPLMRATLMAEYEDVMRREALFRRSRLDAAEREELLDIFLAVCRWTRIYFAWRPSKSRTERGLQLLAKARGR